MANDNSALRVQDMMCAWARVIEAGARRLHAEPTQDLAVAAWQYTSGSISDATDSARRASTSLRDLMVQLGAPLSVDNFAGFCDRRDVPLTVAVTADEIPASAELVAALWVATSVLDTTAGATVDLVVGRTVDITIDIGAASEPSGGLWDFTDGVALVEAFGGSVRCTPGTVSVSVLKSAPAVDADDV